MAYEKTTWVKGDIVTAQKLNKIEQGIYDANDGGNLATPDWNQNDPIAGGYIANRPFYEEEEYVELLDETFSFPDGGGNVSNTIDLTSNISNQLENGLDCVVIYDGNNYNCEMNTSSSLYFLGSMNMSEDDAFPFLLLFDQQSEYIRLVISNRPPELEYKSIAVLFKQPVVYKIDSKYLPNDLSDRIAKGVDDQGNEVEGAVIEGFIKGIISDGEQIPANEASEAFSHAEGIRTTANGPGAHAEGFTTTATGVYSHAEGSGTIANHKSQHVSGEYNIADPSNVILQARGNYIEIVGNGTDENNRSNARTLDWNGNETLAGSLTLGKGTVDEVTLTATQLRSLINLIVTEA